MSEPRRHWNYRVIEFVELNGEPWRAIHEVHYEDDRPVMYTEEPAIVMWDKSEGDSSPRSILKRMIECLSKPALKESDFRIGSDKGIRREYYQ